MDSLIILTDIAEKLILVTLFGLSVWSVSIMIDRRRRFRGEALHDYAHLKTAIENKNLEAIRTWCEANSGFLGGALQVLIAAEKTAQSVDRAVASYGRVERLQLEKGLAVLATLGSNAPFIGLLGTVLGIIRAFAYLGSQSGSSAVMSGVSQALYATAFGLFVAIPAVVAFNYFSKKIRDLFSVVDSLKDLYISQL